MEYMHDGLFLPSPHSWSKGAAWKKNNSGICWNSDFFQHFYRFYNLSFIDYARSLVPSICLLHLGRKINSLFFFFFKCLWTTFKRQTNKQVLTEGDGGTSLFLFPGSGAHRMERGRGPVQPAGFARFRMKVPETSSQRIGVPQTGDLRMASHEHKLLGGCLICNPSPPTHIIYNFSDLKNCAWSPRDMIIHHGTSL